MSRNLPLFEDVLSVEEHVLGCMCDSFSSDHEFEEMQKFFQYQRPLTTTNELG